MAARVKVIDLAKELGVTSKDLIVALESMGQKGMRAMSPLQTTTANELRVKLGRGRDLPEEAKPKRVPKAKPAVTEPKGPGASRKKIDGAEPSAKPARKKAGVLEPEEPLAPQPAEELKPAATLFRHTAAAGPVEAAPATPLSPAPAPIVPAPSALPSAPASPAPVRPTTVTPTTVTPTIGTPATKDAPTPAPLRPAAAPTPGAPRPVVPGGSSQLRRRVRRRPRLRLGPSCLRRP